MDTFATSNPTLKSRATPATRWISSLHTLFPKTSGTSCPPKLRCVWFRIKLSPRVKGHRHECYKEAWHLLHEAIAKKDVVSGPELDTAAEGDAGLPEPV